MVKQKLSPEIGRVVAVDAAQVVVELSKDLKALVTSTFEGASEVGRINSYIVIPTGAHRVVGMVTRVVMSEETQLRADQMTLSLPAAKRHLYATLIGTIEGESFEQGVSAFPVLDAPTLLASKSDLSSIFGSISEESPPVSDKPGFCISIGSSAIFREYDVLVNPDVFLGKHVAVLGSTGSGKSCSVATILQSILEADSIRNATFVVFDTNGEYRPAFARGEEKDSRFRTLYLPSDPLQPSDRLVIPYWFMDSEDFCRLFRASEGTQRPVLVEALGRARSGATPSDKRKWFLDSLRIELNNLLGALAEQKSSLDVYTLANGLAQFMESESDLSLEVLGSKHATVTSIATDIAQQARPHVGEYNNRPSYNLSLPAQVRVSSRDKVQEVLEAILGISRQETKNGGLMTADSPSFFNKGLFLGQHMEQALRMQPGAEGRTREYCSTMLMRISRLLGDRRFDFLFGPPEDEWPAPLHSLAAFLRDILGLPSKSEKLSDADEVEVGVLPFYDRQRQDVSGRRNIIIVDLSLLATEVLENIIALLGRLILEFLQRASDASVSGIGRGKLPVVLVLEEAQNYIRESRQLGEPSVSRDVFERIAREGRKYGLGLVVASQRPSELSKTVLSQCNSFVVHRLQNPEDLRYFREIVPAIFDPLLKQLPSLPQRYALVLGEGVRAPTLTYMREATPIPDSQDPKLYAHWAAKDPALPDVEAVCARWEGKNSQGGGESPPEPTLAEGAPRADTTEAPSDEEVPF